MMNTSAGGVTKVGINSLSASGPQNSSSPNSTTISNNRTTMITVTQNNSPGSAPASEVQKNYNNSIVIRQEIQRFEAVHPSIYAVYDLLDLIPDPVISRQIRDQVVSIEGMSPFF